jgi:hypothetical protein
MNEKLSKMVDAHWEYIESLLEREIPKEISFSKDQYIHRVGFHYKTAMIHGYKHGLEDK